MYQLKNIHNAPAHIDRDAEPTTPGDVVKVNKDIYDLMKESPIWGQIPAESKSTKKSKN